MEITVKREAINPWDWGLGWSMDSEVFESASRHVHCAGQLAVRPNPGSHLGIEVISPDDIRGQLEAALANVDAVLEKAGMTRANVTSLRFFTTDIEGFLENYDVYVEWIAGAGNRPPQSLIGVACLILPELKVEIEATAAA